MLEHGPAAWPRVSWDTSWDRRAPGSLPGILGDVLAKGIMGIGFPWSSGAVSSADFIATGRRPRVYS